MKKLLYLSLCLGFLLSCNSREETIHFRGICVDDPQGTEGLYNSERGFRLEVALNVGDGNASHAIEELREEVAKYASDSVSLVQSYFYLTDLVGKDLSEKDFETMQSYFDELQNLGMKAVLRFAYERDFNGRAPVGPTEKQALAHLDQLKPFLEKNKDLILVVQAGVIGAWGEWHSSVHGLENSDDTKRSILEKLLAVVPNERNVQVRVPDYKNLLKNTPESYNRLSFHDDFIVIKADKWDGDMHEGTNNFDQIVKESPYLVVDGELPWGFWSVGNDPDAPSAGWIIDGHETARRLFLQHYTSLSVIHNYKEKHENTKDLKELPKYSMLVWKETPLSESFLKENKMPVSANYFQKKDGSVVERNVFDYIRDHLGYRIELQDLSLTNGESKEEKEISLSLINRGFSTLFNEHDVYFVLINEAGEVTEFKTDADIHTWQPYNLDDISHAPLVHQVKSTIKLPVDSKEGNYKLGLWIADRSERLKYNPRYAIRTANGDVNWWVSKDKRYGINILTDIKL